MKFLYCVILQVSIPLKLPLYSCIWKVLEYFCAFAWVIFVSLIMAWHVWSTYLHGRIWFGCRGRCMKREVEPLLWSLQVMNYMLSPSSNVINGVIFHKGFSNHWSYSLEKRRNSSLVCLTYFMCELSSIKSMLILIRYCWNIISKATKPGWKLN